MDILKFALGMRFDFLKDSFSDEDVSFILSEVTKVLSASDVEGLHFYGGSAKLDERDSCGIFTIVFMNAKMKFLRSVYRKLNSDAILRSYSDHRIPFIQNNLIRNFAGLEFYGIVGPDGRLSEGSGREIVFPETAEVRKQFSDSSPIIVAPGRFDPDVSAKEASMMLRRELRNAYPDSYIVPVHAASRIDLVTDAVEYSLPARRHGMYTLLPDGSKVYAEYLAYKGCIGVICSDQVPSCSSFVLGKLLLRAVHEGLKTVYLFLRKEDLEDKGFGLARAVGCVFADSDGSEITDPSAYTSDLLPDTSSMDPLVRNAKIVLICDELGVSSYAPLKNICSSVMSCEEAVLKIASFDSLIKKASCVITGGGESKVVDIISAKALKAGVRTIVLPALLEPAETKKAIAAICS